MSRRQQYAKEKIAEWKEAFSIFDQDGNGEITIVELAKVMTQLGKTPSDAELQAIIKDVDKDGSGTIDFDEFCEMMHKQEADALPENELREAFNLCDRDGSGTISADELLYVMNNVLGENMTKAEVDAMIKEADQDGSGEIDFTEFAKIMGALNSKS